MLIPVWCPGVDNQKLVQSMGALQIAEIHTNVKIAAWPSLQSSNPFQPQIAEILTLLNGVMQEAQPRHEIEKLLIANLEQGASDSALEKIAKDYQLAALPAGAQADRAVLLARLFLDFGEKLGDDRFQRLRSGIPMMAATLKDYKERVPEIIRLVAPFCWVSPDSVIPIPAIMAQPTKGIRAIAWVRRWPFSERMYLFRALCTQSKLRFASPSALTSGASGAIFDHIVACLADKVCNDPEADQAAVNKRITKRAADGESVFLILATEGIDNTILMQVCTAFPNLCVFLHTDTMTEQELLEQFPSVQIVEPFLSKELESDARAGWGDCMKDAGLSSVRAANLEEFYP
jgi:hypothetical protein